MIINKQIAAFSPNTFSKSNFAVNCDFIYKLIKMVLSFNEFPLVTNWFNRFLPLNTILSIAKLNSSS